MIEHSEHRHSKRVDLAARVHLRCGDQPEVVLMSHDWTDRSVFLRSQHTLPLGTRVTLSVVVPHQQAPITMEGTIARVVASDHNSPTRPPGMAIHFGEMPAALRAHLASLYQHTSIKNALDPLVEARTIPSVLVIASSTEDRLTAVHTLEAAGYDVTEANTVSSLQNALTMGARFQAALFIGKVTRGDLLGLAQTLATEAAEGVTIEIETPATTLPSALSDPLECPLVVLPPDASAESIRDAVAGHVKPSFVEVETAGPAPRARA